LSLLVLEEEKMSSDQTDDMNVHTQFCLVSGEQMPNLLPIFQLGAKRVVLFATPQMSHQSELLKKTLRQRLPAIEVVPVNLDDAYDFNAISNTVLDELAKAETIIKTDNSNGEIVLNATGGTKVMVLAAVSIFSANGNRVFYLSEATNELIFLPIVGSNEAQITKAVSKPIRLLDYLAVYDVTVETQKEESPALSDGLFLELISRQQKYERGIAALNALAQAAFIGSKGKKIISTEMDTPPNSDLNKLLSYFEQEKLLKIDGKKITFTSEQARFAVNGGWFEDYTFKVVNSLRSHGVHDPEKNLRIAPQGQLIGKGADYEIDSCFMHNHTIYLVECKTCLMEDTKVTTPILNKLSAISQSLGKKVRSILISYQRVNPNAKARAANENIAVIDGNSICKLKIKLLDILTEKSPAS